ncbi:MAG TPA: FAD-binding oxidoreductase [Gaiellaceae bacterium]|nr:FAD-binding oxidoreductase [Gaiellaceae bacterium]
MGRLFARDVHGPTAPWWQEEAPPDDELEPLAGDTDADVVIVGGGFTGVWTALELKRLSPDTRVVLLEAARCGDGASGRNGGFLHGYWASLPRLVDLFGPEEAVALARESTGVYDAVRALGEDVWLTEGGMLTVAIGPAHDAELEHAVAVAAAVGAPEQAVPIERGGLSVESPAFRGAVFYRDAATVQPARLVRALRRAAVSAGVEIHERTPVLEINGSVVRCDRASVRADEIVVATNASSAVRWPAARRVAVFRSAIVLTEPVPDLHERIGWSGGEAIADARTYLSYFRLTNDNRVLMGSASGDYWRAEAALRQYFPQLAGVQVAARWEGAVDVSSDRLPVIGTVPGTRVHYAAGFTGNGVGPSWLVGRTLARLVRHEDVQSPLLAGRAPSLPPEPLRSIGAGAVRRALLAIDDAETVGRRAPRWAAAIRRAPELVGLRVASR